jgi:hypothetical protein
MGRPGAQPCRGLLPYLGRWVISAMQHLARPPLRLRGRALYGFTAYWALNLGLLLAEVRWHVLSRLTLWDFSMIRTALIAASHHPH